MRYGASQEDWTSLDLCLGLTSDLLPTVSRPDAKISEHSTMKDLGKVPSLYNRKGEVAGIVNWTRRISSAADVERWSAEPDYGICVQTRTLKAFDIDVEDETEANKIWAWLVDRLGELPTRGRGGSNRLLVIVQCAEKMTKRTIKVDSGMVEFLGNGQQFVAYGTHPSGNRYEWDWCDLPVVSKDKLESLWAEMVEVFGKGDESITNVRKRGDNIDMNDRVSKQLVDSNLAIGQSMEGAIHIECPFKHEHSQESSISATSYFPAGTNGYEVGHFKCMHAHCANRTDQEFMDALGLTAGGTDLFDSAVDTEVEAQPWPDFKRTKSGEIVPSLHNISLALNNVDVCGHHVAHDEFLGEIMIKGKSGVWREFRDEDYTRLKIELESGRGFGKITSSDMREVVYLVAKQNKFDSATEWLEGLKWDGVKRVKNFFADYMGVKGSWGESIAQYMFTAMAGRVIRPGVKADMVPILVGKQGLMKSTAIEALAPAPELYEDLSLDGNEEDRVRKMRGALMVEIGELRGMYSAKLENIKAFITRTHDTWVPKYKEMKISAPRRCIFIGTSNHHEILNDPTGNRRFLPIEVKDIDLEAIKRDRDQLWAEGLAMFEKDGILWRGAEEKGDTEREEFSVVDPWLTSIEEWLYKPSGGWNDSDDEANSVPAEEGATSEEILRWAIGISNDKCNIGHARKIGELMRGLGFEQIKMKRRGKTLRVWRNNLW